MRPAWPLSLSLDLGMELDVVVLSEGNLMAVALAETDLVVVALRRAPAWFLVELGLMMDPAWLLNPHLDTEGLELVVEALSPVPCPGFGLIYA